MTPLQTELALPAYAGLADADAAARLNAPLVTSRKLVAMGDIKPILYQDALPCAMIRLEDAANQTATTPQGMSLVIAARTVFAWLTDPHIEHIDLDNPTAKAGLAAIVAGGVISQALADQIDALANVATTRAAQLGYRKPITAAMITVARSPE